MAEDEYRDDLYEILGLEAASDEKQVARAYKKKSLLHHPDRGGDVKKFLELKHARDVLLDPKKKEQYDKKLSQELMAKKKQREREAELDGKRRQMRDELLRKEQSHDLKHKQKRDTAGGQYRKSDLSKLREKGLARQKEMEERLARDARRREEVDQLRESLASRSASKSQCTVTVKWDRKQFSHSDDTLSHAFRVHGEIASIKVKSSSAKIVFVSAASAAKSVRIEGHASCWREVSIQGHIVEAEDHAAAEGASRPRSYSAEGAEELPGGPISLRQHLDYEHRVLDKLRERALHQQEQQQKQASEIPV
ncbi:DNA damage-inducible protein [Globisporangium polare]